MAMTTDGRLESLERVEKFIQQWRVHLGRSYPLAERGDAKLYPGDLIAVVELARGNHGAR